MQHNDIETFEAFNQKYKQLKNEIGKVIIGQHQTIDQILIALFCKGHSLLVGVPGLAKTLLVNTIADALNLKFNRIQFTPDLMPSDIIGTEILDENKQFKFVKGPIFANLILADEINRTPPKTQAALLEAMQESTVTTSGKKFDLGNPFFVIATQNPIEQEGTYPLPEAQLDRFMFNIHLDYPSYEEELDIVKNTTTNKGVKANAVLTAQEIINFQQLIRKIPVADNVYQYAVKLTNSTRKNSPFVSELTTKYIEWGAGPRASQNLILAAKCHAAINGKYSPDIENIQQVTYPILNHRLILNYKAEAEGISKQQLVEKML